MRFSLCVHLLDLLGSTLGKNQGVGIENVVDVDGVGLSGLDIRNVCEAADHLGIVLSENNQCLLLGTDSCEHVGHNLGLVLLGIPQGVNNIITYAMIGDTVDYLEWKTGERGEGICFAMQTLINKIGMAVGAFIGVMALDIAQINTKTYEVGNEPALWNVLVLSGAISMFACAIPMFFYTLTEKRQRELVAEIEARKASK